MNNQDETIIDIHENKMTVQEAAKRFDLAPIIKRFGTWAVTTYGLECLAHHYPIALSRVFETDWVSHMERKKWVNIDEFEMALYTAQEWLTRRKEFTVGDNLLKVFLCHGKEDKQIVRDIYNKLLLAGIDPWLDEESLLPGQDWNLEIAKAVRSCDVILVFLSKSSASKTGFVQKEIKYALDVADEKPEGAIYIIPARLEDCVVPERLKKWHWVDLYNDSGFNLLMKSLKQCVHTKSL